MLAAKTRRNNSNLHKARTAVIPKPRILRLKNPGLDRCPFRNERLRRGRNAAGSPITCVGTILRYNPRHHAEAQSEVSKIGQTKVPQESIHRRKTAERRRYADRHFAPARRPGNPARSRTARPDWPHAEGGGLHLLRAAPRRRSPGRLSAPRSLGQPRRAYRTYAHAAFSALECRQGRAPHFPRRHLLEANRIESVSHALLSLRGRWRTQKLALRGQLSGGAR